MVLVVQSFGKESEYRRAVLTILSYFAFCPSATRGETYLFSDNPDFFRVYLDKLPVRHFLLTDEKIKSMKGEIDFLHRIKVAVIEEAFSEAQDGLLYADSDTFFTGDPTPFMQAVAPDVAYMHLCEYQFNSLSKMKLPAGAPFHAFLQYIQAHQFEMPDGSQVSVSDDQYSWNAGVMILHASHARLLPQVYALTNYFYRATQNHASEQYAFSIVLQNHTALHPAEAVSYHYWYRVKKEVMDLFLQKEITQAWGQRPLTEKLNSVRRWVDMLPSHIENHILLVRDCAIQAFHEDNFGTGLSLAIRALIKSPFNLKFTRNVLYHLKRRFIPARQSAT